MRYAIVGDKELSANDSMSLMKSEYVLPYTHLKNTAVTTGEDGVGALAHTLHVARGKPTIVFRPDWTKHGKRAKYVRNQRIADTADELRIYSAKPMSEGLVEWSDLTLRFSKAGKTVFYHELSGTGEYVKPEEVDNA